MKKKQKKHWRCRWDEKTQTWQPVDETAPEGDSAPEGEQVIYVMDEDGKVTKRTEPLYPRRTPDGEYRSDEFKQ